MANVLIEEAKSHGLEVRSLAKEGYKVQHCAMKEVSMKWMDRYRRCWTCVERFGNIYLKPWALCFVINPLHLVILHIQPTHSTTSCIWSIHIFDLFNMQLDLGHFKGMIFSQLHKKSCFGLFIWDAGRLWKRSALCCLVMFSLIYLLQLMPKARTLACECP